MNSVFSKLHSNQNEINRRNLGDFMNAYKLNNTFLNNQ